jgi:tetratricopeptide (TPR) repeat protein
MHRNIVRLMAALILCPFASARAQTPADAAALEREGKFAEAADAWRGVIKREPSDAAAWASLGLALARTQDYANAVTAYKKAAALNPKLPGLQLNLGLAEFKGNNLDAAIAPFRMALAADPKNQQARTLLGLSYYGTGKFGEAATHLEIAIKVEPSNAALHRLLAQSCLNAKKYPCALDEFKWLLEQNPDSVATHLLMGQALDGLSRTPEAIAEFQAAVKADAKAPNANFGLGYLYWKSHQYEEAERAFEAELGVDPDNAQALAYLGDIELRNGNTGKALELLRKAAQRNENLRVAFLDLGVILTEQKKYDQALAELQRAEKLDPQQPDVHYRLGRLYQAMGRSAEAEKEMARVKELHEKDDEDLAGKMSGEKPKP